ncbi:hypothetical protein L7F22_002668 [Adiantum nelumboides]|nr:hypothetical protein [Adiantum nelumboides]
MASTSNFDSTLFIIEKLEGHSYAYWKEQIYNVLVQKKQSKPICLQGIKPDDMDAEDWLELDELTRSTIMLTLHKSVYFNVKDTKGAYGVWTVLSNLYEKKSAASQVYWLKKLINLRMKESTPMLNHLNEFHTMQSQGVEFDDSVRAMFLLITLPDLWDTFCITLSNSVALDGLKCADVESSLLMKEVNRKNVEDTKSSSAMHRRGHAQRQEPPSKEKERSKSPDESMEEDVALRRRPVQRSPTPTKRKRSPQSPPHLESKKEAKDSEEKGEKEVTLFSIIITFFFFG